MPDPVEERQREMAEAMVRWDTWEQDVDPEIRSQYIERGGRLLTAAGVPSLLADTQHKDKRIAELEGALARFLDSWDEFNGPPLTVEETHAAVAESVEALRAALATQQTDAPEDDTRRRVEAEARRYEADLRGLATEGDAPEGETDGE